MKQRWYLTEVRIDNFWGRLRAEVKLDPEVNIFIGRNGTGKTTFINILQAILSVDLTGLATLDFSAATLLLTDGSRVRTIRVERVDNPEVPFEEVTFHVSKRKFTIPLYSHELEPERFLMRRHSFREEFGELRREMESLVNLSSISVHRENRSLTEDHEYRTRRGVPAPPPLDSRLAELVQQFTRYQLMLAEKANRVSGAFQTDVLASILYNESFDRFSPDDMENVDYGTLEEDLLRAYSELGALNEQTSARIAEHVAVLKRSAGAVREFRERDTDKRISIEDIMPLPLGRRTAHIIELSLKADKAKQEMIAPQTQFLATLHEFIDDKDVSLDAKGGLVIRASERTLPVEELSSGEKQIMIFLTETILQRRRFHIFIADEPELSLHIEWQAKIVRSLKKLNPHSQIIVATHSPEIAADYRKKLIDMEEVIHA